MKPELRRVMKFPAKETREIRNGQGYVRTYVRLAGQQRWYASLATAQVAFQRNQEQQQREAGEQ